MNWELRIEAISWLSLLKIHKFWKKLFISSFYPRLTLFLLKLYFTHSTSSLNKCYASFEPTISWYVFRRLSRNHEKKRKITGKRLLRATCNINLIFESRRNDIYDRTNYRLIVSLWPPTRGLLKSGWKPEQTWGDPDCQQPSPWGTPRRWARSLGQERDERRTTNDEQACFSRGTLAQFSHCSGWKRCSKNERLFPSREEDERRYTWAPFEDRDRPGSVGGPWLIDN